MPSNTEFVTSNQPNHFSEGPIEDASISSTHTIHIPRKKTFKNINEVYRNLTLYNIFKYIFNNY